MYVDAVYSFHCITFYSPSGYEVNLCTFAVSKLFPNIVRVTYHWHLASKLTSLHILHRWPWGFKRWTPKAKGTDQNSPNGNSEASSETNLHGFGFKILIFQDVWFHENSTIYNTRPLWLDDHSNGEGQQKDRFHSHHWHFYVHLCRSFGQWACAGSGYLCCPWRSRRLPGSRHWDVPLVKCIKFPYWKWNSIAASKTDALE